MAGDPCRTSPHGTVMSSATLTTARAVIILFMGVHWQDGVDSQEHIPSSMLVRSVSETDYRSSRSLLAYQLRIHDPVLVNTRQRSEDR